MKTVVLMLALLFLAGTPAWAADTSNALHSSLQTALSNYLATRGKIEHISAASLSIDLHGSTSNINVTAGTTQIGGNRPVTPDNLFQIGSNTKAFTSSIILQLEAERKLSIEDPLGKFLPQYPAWKGITIHRLLDMTSPIPSYDNDATFSSLYVAHTMRKFTPAEIVQYCYPGTPGAPQPTHGWSYSNTNYLLSELIIEKVTGRSYQSEVQRRILNAIPLENMYYSGHLYPPAVTMRMVSGYWWNHIGEQNKPFAPLLGKDVRLDSLSWAAGAGAAVGSPEAMTHWIRALFESPTFLPQTQRREMMQIVSLQTGKPISSTTLEDSRGFGLGVAQITQKETGTIWFYEGETLGYRMLYAYFPREDAVFDIGLNSQPDSNQDHIGKLLTSIYSTLKAAGKI